MTTASRTTDRIDAARDYDRLRSMLTGRLILPGDADYESEAWLKGMVAALDQGVPVAYVNFLGDEGEERLHAAYPGATWDRLARIKTGYDPDNVFQRNQNIPPASG